MFMIRNKIHKSSVSWKAEAAKIHAERWEYLHSDMHAAGYALDPEFMEMTDDMDESTQNGLMNVIEKICLRDEIGKAADPAALICKLGADGSKEEALLKKVADRVAKACNQFSD